MKKQFILFLLALFVLAPVMAEDKEQTVTMEAVSADGVVASSGGDAGAGGMDSLTDKIPQGDFSLDALKNQLGNLSSGGGGSMPGGGGGAPVNDSALKSIMTAQKSLDSEVLNENIDSIFEQFKSMTSLGMFTGGLSSLTEVFPEGGESTSVKDAFEKTPSETPTDKIAAQVKPASTSGGVLQYLPSPDQVKAYAEKNLILPYDTSKLTSGDLKKIRASLPKLKGAVATAGTAKSMVEMTVATRTLTSLKDDFDNNINNATTQRESIAINNNTTGSTAEIYKVLVDSAGFKNTLNAIETIEKVGTLKR